MLDPCQWTQPIVVYSHQAYVVYPATTALYRILTHILSKVEGIPTSRLPAAATAAGTTLAAAASSSPWPDSDSDEESEALLEPDTSHELSSAFSIESEKIEMP